MMLRRKLDDFKSRRQSTSNPTRQAFRGYRFRLQLEGLEERQLLSAVPANPEFRVNTYTTSLQDHPAVASDVAGDYVAVWESRGQDGSGYGIYAQRYNAAGAAQGSEFRVNTYTTLGQSRPSVAMDGVGDFVVAWESDGQDGSGYGIYAQRYNASGAAQGSEFQVNSYTTDKQRAPRVACDAAGDFVVAWDSNGQDGSGYGIYAQRYNAAGAAQGSEFRVNTYTTLGQYSPSVAMDGTGNFAVAWESNGQDGSGYGIYAQRFNASGAAQGSEFRVNTYTTNWQTNQSVAMDGTGDFVVAWESSGQDGSGDGIYAQRYNASGAAQDSEFRVNTYTTFGQFSPSLAMDGTGDFAVAWESDGQDGSGYGIYAQRYDAFGAAQGSEFQVNTNTTSNQSYASVAMDGTGNFAVAWDSDGQDGSGYGIYAQQYVAPPRVTALRSQIDEAIAPSSILSNDVRSLIVQFSEAMSTTGGATGVNSVTNPANYQLSDGGTDFSGIITGVTYGYNPATGHFEATIALASPLRYGSYKLTARQALQSANGVSFDGDFVRPFEVGATFGAGPEFRVNSHTPGSQASPAIASDAAGDYVVTWSSADSSQDGSGYGIYAQRYSASGAAAGSEFQVNTYTTNQQRFPSVAMDAGGDFVVVWNSFSQDGSGYGIYGQRYSAAGVAQGGEFSVNTYTTGNQRSQTVAMDTAGDFVVAWQSYGPVQDSGGNGIYAQRYNAAGVAQGGEFRVNSTTAGDQTNPSVTMDAAGNFGVVWQSFGEDGDGYGIYGQAVLANGAFYGGETRVNSYTTGNQLYPSIVVDGNGDVVVAWVSNLQDGSGYGIYAQRYAGPLVAPVGGEFRVNTYTTDSQVLPRVATDAAGDFVVTWMSAGQDGNYSGVYAQRYSSAGTPSGSEFRVNTYTTNEQQYPSVAMDATGDFVVAWYGAGQGGDGYDVYAQRYIKTSDVNLQVAIGSVSPNPATVNQSYSYTVTVSNSGETDATNVQVVQVLAAGEILDSITPSAGGTVTPVSATQYNISFATLVHGANATLLVQAHAPLAGSYLDTAYEIADQAEDNTYDNRAHVTETVSNPGSIVGRFLFYKGSSRYDLPGGSNPAITSGKPFSDDNAIATDKSAYLPNGAVVTAATFANISSYSLGINGIMIDLAGTHGTITANDFTFRLGNNNTPSGWSLPVGFGAPTVLVRPGAGGAGSDRIELIWPDNAIQKQWLEVIVNANANTGLATADKFFFGSAVGDSVSDVTSARVDINDELAARNNPKLLGQNIPITNLFDYNRDGKVDITDQLLSRNNQTIGPNVTKFIVVDAAAAAPEISPASIDSGFASAIFLSATTASDTGAHGPTWSGSRVGELAVLVSTLTQAQRTDYFRRLAEADAGGVQAILLKGDAADVDDAVLDSLIGNWART